MSDFCQNVVWKTILPLIVLLLFIVACSVAVAAERVHISASNSGHYDFENQIFVASGAVEITYGDLILQGEELYADLVSGQIKLEGNVSLMQADLTLRGEFLTFDLETGKGQLDEARTEIALPEETGIIYLAGEAINLQEENYKVANASFTTCDLPGAHYHLTTKKLEVVVGEKVIIRGVTYYEGKIPLFYWPYLVIPLDDTQERFFSLPVFGFSEQEGYYMKNTFNYYFNSQAYGNVYVDFFSRLGVGTGVRHNYQLNKLGGGYLYLYGLPQQLNSENSVLKAAWNHSLEGENWKFTTETAREDSWVRQELSSNHRLTLAYPNYNGEAWYNYKANPKLSVEKSLDYGLRWSQRLSNSLHYNLRANQIERTRLDTQKLLSYAAEGIYRRDKHTLTLAVEQQYNPDLLKASATRWQSVQRIPEFTWDVSDLGLQNIPLRLKLALGRYEERRPDLVQENRALGQLSLGPKTHPLWKGGNLSYQGDLASSITGAKERQTWLYGRATYNQRLSNGLQLTATYSQREVWGSTPFAFDRQNPLQDLSLRLSYTNSQWYASLSSLYNFKTKNFSPLVMQSRWRPNDNWNLSLYGNYDLNRRELQRIVPMLEYKAGQFAVKAGGRYLFTKGEWEQIDAQISLPLGETWYVSYDSIFKPLQATFSRGTITISKDLHCRKISASYDHVDGRIAFQYTINAFPTLPIGWDSAEGLGLFELEDVSDIIGGME